MSGFRDPNVPDGRVETTLDGMKPIVQQFYQTLYTAEDVPSSRIDDYLNNISFTRQASPEAISRVTAPITIEDLRVQVNRSPRQSSPGSDGLGYPTCKCCLIYLNYTH